MINESFMDFTSENVGGDEGLKMYKRDKGFIDHALYFLFSESSSAFQDRTALPHAGKHHAHPSAKLPIGSMFRRPA